MTTYVGLKTSGIYFLTVLDAKTVKPGKATLYTRVLGKACSCFLHLLASNDCHIDLWLHHFKIFGHI